MKDWQIFEKECAEYLQRKYSDKGLIFKVTGGHDSNLSDIQVLKNGIVFLSIECKMNIAQCGQFVLFTDEINKKFIFSPRNKTPFDDSVKSIINEMENNFEQCNNPSTKDLPIPENVISQWVKNYYLNFKKTKYCITNGKTDFIVLPIEEMDKYFAFSAKFRVKKSGSSNPSKNNIPEINELLKSANIITSIKFTNSKCYVKFSHQQDLFILCGKKYRYQFSKEGEIYKVRRLSNTCNANFIVSIKLKKFAQNNTDLIIFENDLIK